MTARRPRSTRCGRPTVADDAGVTLVELLVAITILGVVMAGLFGGLTGLIRATNTIDTRTDNVDQARLAIASLSRDLRAASPTVDDGPAFLVADDRHARFHARLSRDDAPVLLDLSVDADDRLVETLTPATIESDGTVVYDPADARTRYVASYLFNAADEPILTYSTITESGEVIEMPTPIETVTQLRSIRLVQIDLVMARDQAARVEPQRVSTQVRLPNLRGGS
jgi:prepilin-type N-terminal cleavage/methylation domain-containing protein